MKHQRSEKGSPNRSNTSNNTKAAKNSKKNQFKTNKFPTNKASNVSPIDSPELGQCTQTVGIGYGNDDQYQQLLLEQYGFDPILPDTLNHLKELQKVFCDVDKIENSSQYAKPERVINSYGELSDDSTWQHVDTVHDIDRFMKVKTQEGKVRSACCLEEDQSSEAMRKALGDIDDIIQFMETKKEVSIQPEPMEYSPKNIIISEVPTIKFIAEKFSRFKKNDIEVRKLNEKIVCVEYDIFDQDSFEDPPPPVQKMRAFFSIRPPSCPISDQGMDKTEDHLTEIPSFVKHKYHIADEDLKKLNEKEIEIIDETIAENKPYLEDLKTILKRKQGSRQKKTNLDLKYLYNMAKRECPPSDYDFSKLLSRSELDEVKDLILKRCVSSVHGISKKILRNKAKESTGDVDDQSHTVLTKPTLLELIKERLGK